MTAGRRSGRTTAVLAALVLSACGGSGAGAPGPAGTAGTSGGAQQGRELFVADCASCHGQQAQGTDQGPPLVHVLYEPSHHPDDAFRAAVAQGAQPHHWSFGPMPPVGGLDDEEVDAIIAYVRGLQRDAGIE